MSEATEAQPTGTQRQVAGGHYQAMTIQPTQFCMANGWDCDAFSILKYVSRHKTKNGLVDVDKAIHFIELREENIANGAYLNPRQRISIRVFCDLNGMDDLQRYALSMLDGWVNGSDPGWVVPNLRGALLDMKSDYENAAQ